MLMIYKLTIFVKNKMVSFLFSLILTCTKNPIGLIAQFNRLNI